MAKSAPWHSRLPNDHMFTTTTPTATRETTSKRKTALRVPGGDRAAKSVRDSEASNMLTIQLSDSLVPRNT